MTPVKTLPDRRKAGNRRDATTFDVLFDLKT